MNNSFSISLIQHLHDEMTSEQQQFHASLPTAIVTFKTLQDTSIGLQTCWNNSPVTSFVTQAPAASDIIWENIGLLKHYRYQGCMLSVANCKSHVVIRPSPKPTLSFRAATCNSQDSQLHISHTVTNALSGDMWQVEVKYFNM